MRITVSFMRGSRIAANIELRDANKNRVDININRVDININRVDIDTK